MFHRRIDEFIHLCKIDNIIELAADFGSLHPQNCSVEVDVFPAAQPRMETRSHLQQRCNTTTNLRETGGRFGDSRQYLQKSTLACTVAADETDYFSSLDLHRNVFESPKDIRRFCVSFTRLEKTRNAHGNLVAQSVVVILRADGELLRKIFCTYNDITHVRGSWFVIN